jgi:hypothetical protein
MGYPLRPCLRLVDAATVMDWDRRRKGKGIMANRSRTTWPELIDALQALVHGLDSGYMV